MPLPPLPVVFVRYGVSERLPDRIEEMVTTPLERALVTLPRVTRVSSTTNHGTVDVKIHFQEGATGQDLALVTREIEELQFNSAVVVTSRTVAIRRSD